MGDAPDTIGLVLFVPVLLAPLFALAKWALLRAANESVSRRRMWLAALAESGLPLMCMAALAATVMAVFRSGLGEENVPRRALFVAYLYLASAVLNALCLRVRWRSAAAVALGPPVAFGVAWMVVSRLAGMV